MPTQTQLPGCQRSSNCIYSPWIRKLETLLLCHLGFLWKSHRLSKWIRCHPLIGFLSLIFELVCYRGVSWIVPHGLWHVSTLKSSSRGNKTWPQPLSLAPPPPAQSWLQLSLSRRDSDRWSCCWALGCCQGDFSADKWHVETCHCLDGPSNLGSSWEVSWEASPSLCVCTVWFPRTPTLENGVVYESKGT